MVADSNDASETINSEVATVEPTAGDDMRASREKAGLTLEELATRTRVPLRHLEALEKGEYSSLPGVTYCAGFSRAYARATGLDEAALVAKLRREIEAQGYIKPERYVPEEPVSSNSIPPRYLAWTTAVIAVLVAGGYAIWKMQLNTQPTDQEIADAARPETRITTPGAVASTANATAANAAPAGPVILTAVDEVWLRIYDADGKRLLEKAMAKGESFTVPQDANNPMILTGRPDALAVTVGGQAVPPLGTAERTIADVPISSAALLARGRLGQEVPAIGNSATPNTTGAAPIASSRATTPPTSNPPRTSTPAATRSATPAVATPRAVATPTVSSGSAAVAPSVEPVASVSGSE